MDNMRKRAVSPRKSISPMNVSAGRAKFSRYSQNGATYELCAVNHDATWQSTPAFSDTTAAALLIDALTSAARHSSAISVETLLREPKVSRIIEICRTIRGDKILTVCRDHDASFTISLNRGGTFAGDPSCTRRLRSELSLALQHGGTLVIRQALSLRTRQITHDGEERWNPWRNVYAFNLGNDRFEAVPIADLQYANSIGPDGTPASREQGIRFCEYHIPAQSAFH